MIEHEGTVVTCDGDFAEVEAVRTSACGHCEAKGSCGTSLLANTFGTRSTRVRARNPIGARPGERVLVGLPEGVFVRSALLLYAVPLGAFVLGAVAGQVLWSGEGASILAGIAGLGLGFWWVRRRGEGEEAAAQAVLLRRVGGSVGVEAPVPLHKLHRGESP